MMMQQNDDKAARMHGGSGVSPDFPSSSPGHTSAPPLGNHVKNESFLTKIPTPFSLASSDVAVLHEKRETPRAAAAFHDYAAMGPDRSLEKVVHHYGKKPSYVRQLQRWSAQFHWVERARQYDAQEAENRRRRRQQELEQMDEAHARIGHEHLLKAITAMQTQLEHNAAPFPSLVSLFKYSAELERLARGAATSRLEGDVSIVVQPKEYVNLEPDECGSEE